AVGSRVPRDPEEGRPLAAERPMTAGRGVVRQSGWCGLTIRCAVVLNPASPAATNSPARARYFAFSPDGRFACVVAGMGSTVTAFRYDRAAGMLDESQAVSTLPGGFYGNNNSAEVEIGAAGRFLYSSNRGNDSIAGFSINPDSGTLTRVQIAPTQGRTRRNFTIDPAGNYLLAANRNSGPSPVCIQFAPARWG
ncbi:MAG: lactonase family protein, partial [Pseudomonadota bacterium]